MRTAISVFTDTAAVVRACFTTCVRKDRTLVESLSLRQIDGRWRITDVHESVAIKMDGAAIDLKS